MKKILILLLVIMLVGCSSKEKITIMVPYGSPQMSQLYLQDNNKNYESNVVIGADPLVAAFGSSSHDVIFAPINLGAKMFQSKEDYFLLGVVTWGNYYLVSNVEISEFSELDGKNIIVFGRNQVSDILMLYLESAYQIDITITYVDSLSTATAHSIANPTDIVMVAEPSFSLLKQRNSSIYSIDLQAAYRSVSSSEYFPQAGVFVHRRVSNMDRQQIILDLIKSIENLNSQESVSIDLAIRLGIELERDVLSSAFKSSNIEFKSGTDSKDAIVSFFNLILAMNPQLIGGKLPSEQFYLGE